MNRKWKGITSLATHTAAVLFLLFSAASLLEGEGFDWPSWRGPEGNGISRESAWSPQKLNGNPRPLWTADVGVGRNTVVVQGNSVYAYGMKDGDNLVSCLQADSGQTVWTRRFESYDMPQATPLVNGDSVFVLAKDGSVFCLDSRDGTIRWQKNIVEDFGAVRPYFGFAGSPVVAGRMLLITVNTAGIALDAQTGALAWKSEAPPRQISAYDIMETNGSDYSTPVTYSRGGKSLALFASWKGVSSVNAENGSLEWIYEWEQYSGRHVTDPVILGNSVFLSQNYGGGASEGSTLLDISRGKPRVTWRSKDFSTEISTPVIVDGFLYGGQGGPYKYKAALRCVDLKTGRLAWEQALSDRSFLKCVSVIAAAGQLIVLTDDGVLVVVEASPAGYREIARCSVPGIEQGSADFWVHPVLSNGRIYCKNNYGELICLDVSK